MKIAVVLLTWNSEKTIEKCLKTLLETSRSFALQVLVVDNGSTDSTVKQIEQLQSGFAGDSSLTLFRRAQNEGTTKPRNFALRQANADCDYYCILDSDAYLTADALEKLAACLKAQPECMLVGPKMFLRDGSEMLSARNFPSMGEKFLRALPWQKAQERAEAMELTGGTLAEREVEYLLSACWLLRPDCIQKVGFLDEALFYAPEDAEYCMQIWEKGFTVRYCPQAVIVHDWQRLSRKKLISRHNWVHLKGLFYMWNKHAAWLKQRKKQA